MQSKIAHAAERKAFSVALDQIIKAASGDDREKNLDKLTIICAAVFIICLLIFMLIFPQGSVA